MSTFFQPIHSSLIVVTLGVIQFKLMTDETQTQPIWIIFPEFAFYDFRRQRKVVLIHQSPWRQKSSYASSGSKHKCYIPKTCNLKKINSHQISKKCLYYTVFVCCQEGTMEEPRYIPTQTTEQQLTTTEPQQFSNWQPLTNQLLNSTDSH
jgi:hypothetical protein